MKWRWAPNTMGSLVAKAVRAGTIAAEEGDAEITAGVLAEIKGWPSKQRNHLPSKVVDEANEYFKAVGDVRRVKVLNAKYYLVEGK